MPETLIHRTRESIAAESDDFFKDEKILDYLNQSQRAVVSQLTSVEILGKKSLRVLDNLRDHIDIDVSDLSFTELDNYFFATSSAIPSEIDDIFFVRYDNKTPLIPLSGGELIDLDRSNAKPTKSEGYFYITKDSEGDKVFELFIHEDAGEEDNKSMRVFYFIEPTDLTLDSETLVELPKALEYAVIYGAASFMLMQEGPASEAEVVNVDKFRKLHREEIQINTY